MESGSEASIEVIAVAVPGGALAVEHVTAATSPVLAIHGISSQRKLWNWLRAQHPGLSLIAPDLRGRGDSVGVTGPSSVSRHAADLIAVLDHLGLDAVPVCGMSMGGFVAVELATTYPDRVTDLVLVDGGFPMATAPGLTPEAVPAIFRDRLARLDRDWPSVEDYARFFVEQTAPLLDPADPLLLDYLAHDLSRAPGPAELRCADSGRDRHLLRSLEVAAAHGADPAAHRAVEYRAGQPARLPARRSSSSSATHWGHRARWSAWKLWRVSITPRRS